MTTATGAQSFSKVMHPLDYKNWNGTTWPTFVKATYTAKDGKGRLSITGVEGPKRNGDADGSCGQISLPDTWTPAQGWSWDQVVRLWELWDRWHLNDMRAGCEHQRETGTSREVEVVTYGLTTDAFQLRKRAIENAAKAHAENRASALTETERALILLDDWFKDRHTPPDADSPLSGCFEVRKREQKAIGWVYPSEHPDGMLMRPCDVCGYKYGSSWLYEAVPESVLAEIASFPDSDVIPAWV